MGADVENPFRQYSDEEVALKLQDLTIAFSSIHGEVLAVKSLDLELRRGRVLALVGESGSGKSATAFSILRLLPETATISGVIDYRSLDGEHVNLAGLTQDSLELRRIRGGKIGIVFQEPMSALSPVHRAGPQIEENLLLHESGIGKEAARKRVESMLSYVGIPDPARSYMAYPHELSGGMRQRVVLAMALITEPDILIADEPTTALDVTIQAQILRLLQKLNREKNISILFITHDMGVVARMADEVAVLYQGHLVEYGNARAILKDPLHRYTQALMDAIPSRAKPGTKLPTLGDQLGGEPIPTGKPLKVHPDGRLVATSA